MRKGFRFSVLLCLSTLALHAGFLDEENARALKEKKLVLISIESDTCPYCKKMKKEIFNSTEYRTKIDQTVIAHPNFAFYFEQYNTANNGFQVDQE